MMEVEVALDSLCIGIMEMGDYIYDKIHRSPIKICFPGSMDGESLFTSYNIMKLVKGRTYQMRYRAKNANYDKTSNTFTGNQVNDGIVKGKIHKFRTKAENSKGA